MRWEPRNKNAWWKRWHGRKNRKRRTIRNLFAFPCPLLNGSLDDTKSQDCCKHFRTEYHFSSTGRQSIPFSPPSSFPLLVRLFKDLSLFHAHNHSPPSTWILMYLCVCAFLVSWISSLDYIWIHTVYARNKSNVSLNFGWGSKCNNLLNNPSSGISDSTESPHFHIAIPNNTSELKRIQ